MTFNPQNIHVALLAGGKSTERRISLASGDGVEQALREAGFSVTRLDPANKQDLVRLIEGNFDVAFLALHGKFGEDGTIQGMLELIDLPYTGPGVWSSATAIDKRKSKFYYQLYSLPTPPFMVLQDTDHKTPEDITSELGERCVIKALNEGSSEGVFICNGPEAVQDALNKVFAFGSQALAEQYIAGNEYTVSVLGSENAQALPVIQIIPKNDFYDFESKYAAGGSEHICPAPLDEQTTKQLQEIAVNAHKALECKGVSRTDFIVDEQGKPWILETNTLPGMTETSLLPDAARAIGMSFSDLVTRMVRDALDA